MITHLRGEVSFIAEGKIEVDTGAFGFEVSVTSSVLNRISGIGDQVDMFTYFNVKEAEMSLFGFDSRDELDTFKQLLNVSGVGPKAGIAILSALSPNDLRFAILSQDVKAICRAQGVGKKLAERIVNELKDKVSLEDTMSSTEKEIQTATSAEESGARNEAIMALTVLGYSATEALKAIQGLDIANMDTEEILKAALKRIGKL